MIRGESFTIAMVFNAEYDIETRIQDVTLSVGNITLCQLSDDTIIKSTANTLMCYISSQNTSYLQVGERAITMALTDSVNGVRKAIVSVVPVQNSGNIFENEVNNESANLVLSVTYDITNIVSDLIIADIYMGAGLPHGGVEGQHIRKVSSTNYDVEWSNQLDNITTESFNPNVAGDPAAYVRKWDAAEGTFVFGLPDGGIIQEGKELFDYYVNADTVPLVNGDIVSIVPITGNRKAIARTDVTNATSAKNCIGMVTVPSIAVGASGRITKFGEVHDLLTQLYPDGTELFVSESNKGKWATVGATPPNYTVKIGTVIVSQNGNGIVELGIQCFPKLGDLSDVNGVSSSVNKPIVRKADGVIDAIDTALDIDGITPSSGTLTVTGDLSVDDITSDVVSANTVNVTDLNVTDVESTNGFVKTNATANDFLKGDGSVTSFAQLKAGIYQLYKPDGSAVVLSINAAGQVVIDGDIIQNGSAYETHAENINTPQAVITLRDGATVGLGVGELAGFVIEKYDGVNNGIIAIDKDGVMRIGDVGALQALLTREDLPVDFSLLYFNPVSLRAETVAFSTVKTTLADNDKFIINDSADSNKPKYLTGAKLKEVIKDDIGSEMIFYLSDDTISVLVGVGSQVFVSESTVGYDSVIFNLATL